jgi:hypothetical protein
LVLLAIGLADLIAGGLSGTPRAGRPRLVGAATAVLAGLAGCYLAGFGPRASLALVALVAFTTVAWLWSQTRAGASLGFLGVGLAVTVLVGGIWDIEAGNIIAAGVGTLPYALVSGAGEEELVLALGAGVFLLATGNGIVRAVLTVAGAKIERSQKRLRGGRYIGAIERLLVFGLTLVGEPTAAAIVVAAKSLVRFPELSRTAQAPADDESAIAEVDIVTEYFLLGSLVSWALALAPTALLVGAG